MQSSQGEQVPGHAGGSQGAGFASSSAFQSSFSTHGAASTGTFGSDHIGSTRSLGSVGSVGSMGSVGSLGSVGSMGSAGSLGSAGSFGGAGSQAFGAHVSLQTTGGQPGAYSSRSENRMEERYENGRLVTGVKEAKEWEDGELLRHDREHYGEVSHSLRSVAVTSECKYIMGETLQSREVFAIINSEHLRNNKFPPLQFFFQSNDRDSLRPVVAGPPPPC